MKHNLTKMATVLSLSVSLAVIGQPVFAKTSFTPLKSGMKGQTVQEVEKMLKALNFDYKLKVDKLYNKYTALNVKKFQKSVKLKQTGTVNKLTYDKLKKAYANKQKASNNDVSDSQKDKETQTPNSENKQPESTKPDTHFSDTLKLGSSGKEVKALQEDLKQLGYNVTVSGNFDASTRLAVMIFQSRHSLGLTGEADSKLIAAISKQAQEKPSQSGEQSKPTTPSKPTLPSTPAAPDQSNQTGNSNPSAEVPLPAGLTSEEKEMVQLVNQERASRGLQPLQVDMNIVKTARVKAQDMVNNGYFSHTSPTYGSPFQMMDTFGINYRAAAENIAQNRSVSAAHASFMGSSGHKANILNATYTHVGIAVVDGGPHGKTFVQMFVKY